MIDRSSSHFTRGDILFSIFTLLKLCLATATYNFKWVKITQNVQNIDVEALI